MTTSTYDCWQKLFNFKNFYEKRIIKKSKSKKIDKNLSI